MIKWFNDSNFDGEFLNIILKICEIMNTIDSILISILISRFSLFTFIDISYLIIDSESHDSHPISC